MAAATHYISKEFLATLPFQIPQTDFMKHLSQLMAQTPRTGKLGQVCHMHVTESQEIIPVHPTGYK